MLQAVIDGDENVIASEFGSFHQLAILLALQVCKLCGMGDVILEAETEADGQALVEQDLHAIRASNDSLASSSACIAISRVTVGNWSRNSPGE